MSGNTSGFPYQRHSILASPLLFHHIRVSSPLWLSFPGVCPPLVEHFPFQLGPWAKGREYSLFFLFDSENFSCYPRSKIAV